MAEKKGKRRLMANAFKNQIKHAYSLERFHLETRARQVSYRAIQSPFMNQG